MPGPGRPPIRPTITHVRELTPHDLNTFRQGRDPPIRRYRDSHHQMARLFAMGLRVSEVAAEMGYSISRVSVHYNSPIFKELVAQYSAVNDEITRDSIKAYNDLILSNGMKAERKIADKLDDDENDELSIRELLSIARDAADRVGLSKRSIQTNVSVDFASMLDKALDRTARTRSSGDLKLKVIEATALPVSSSPSTEQPVAPSPSPTGPTVSSPVGSPFPRRA